MAKAKAPTVWHRTLLGEGRAASDGLVSGNGLGRIRWAAGVVCIWFCDRFMMAPMVLDGSQVLGGGGRTGVGGVIGPGRYSLG